MAKEITKTVIFGNFEVQAACIHGDVTEELSDATVPGKQELVKGIKRLRYRTNVGEIGEPKWQTIPKSTDFAEVVAELETLKVKLRKVTKERDILRRRVNSFELLGTESIPGPEVAADAAIPKSIQ